MKTHNARRLIAANCLLALAAAGWLGCSSDDGSERAESTQASVEVRTGNAPGQEECLNKGNQYVYAYVHPFADAGEAPGEVTKYTVQFPAPPSVICNSDGSVGDGGLDCNAVLNYEADIKANVPMANGYEYLVSMSNDPQSLGPAYLAVGINEWNTPRRDSPLWTSPNPGGPAAATDWNREYSIAESGQNPPVNAIFVPLQCVWVVAIDGPRAGTVIDYFPLMDLHDPNGPNWSPFHP